MRARIVLHGKEADHEGLREAVATLRDEGFDLDVRVTWEGGDAIRLAEEAARLGVDRVVAGGGDGTVNEVLAGLVAADFRGVMGIVPLGTANDFAQSAGIPLEMEPALRCALAGREHVVDVGRVDDRPFLNVATGGFGAEVTNQTDPRLKKVLGRTAYFLTGVAKFGTVAPVPARVTLPEETWEGELLVIGVGNGRQAGGGNVLCPTARLDDGLLDLVLLPFHDDVPIHEALSTLMSEEALEEATLRWRVPWVEVTSEEVVTVNLDGEPRAATTHRFEVAPGALTLALPEGCPLIADD